MIGDRLLHDIAIMLREQLPGSTLIGRYDQSMSEMPIQDAQDHLGEVVSRSSSTGEVVYLTDHAERVAAIMPARRGAIGDGLLAVEEYETEQGPIPQEEARKAHEILARAGVVPG